VDRQTQSDIGLSPRVAAEVFQWIEVFAQSGMGTWPVTVRMLERHQDDDFIVLERQGVIPDCELVDLPTPYWQCASP